MTMAAGALVLTSAQRSGRPLDGAATIDGRLKAHVWVRSGDLDVTGCDIAGDYAELARFPAP